MIELLYFTAGYVLGLIVSILLHNLIFKDTRI